jgi:drug/metabolite transporter (DMT)-like permease
MWLALGIGSALAWGVADFCGGLAARRSRAVSVLAIAFPLGLVLVSLLSLALREQPDLAEVVWGGASGIASGVGLLLLYAGLALGPMNVVAPVSAVTSAVVPVAAGLAMGEQPGAIVLVGVGLTVVAGVLIGLEPPEAAEPTPSAGGRGVLTAVGAGLGIGMSLVLLEQADPATASLWTVASNRLTASVTVLGVALLLGASLAPSREARPLAMMAGVADAAANCLYFLALRTGLLSVVGVLTALYPAGTVLLARVVLKERLHPPQIAGLALAGVALVMITLG